MLERIQKNIGLPAILLYWGLGIVSYLLFRAIGADWAPAGWLLGVPFVAVGIFVSIGWFLGRKS